MVEKIEIPLEQSVNSNETKAQETTKQITITPEEAARGKTIENTKRTVNEYGVTIYGKVVGTSSGRANGQGDEVANSIIERNNITDKNMAKKGGSYTYTEYYSDAYGGKVYLRITDQTGGIEIFNEKGQKFLAGDKPQNDIEVGLANYRMGNAMAEAIDRSVKNNK